MRHGEITPIAGAWSDEENAWVSEPLMLRGDCWVEVTLADKGRMVIRKSEEASGRYLLAMVTPWSGPSFRIRVYGSTQYRYIKIFLTDNPTKIEYANI